MRSIIVTASIVLLATIGVLSFLIGWIGAGIPEEFAAIWLLFGIGAVALVGAALLARNPTSRITISDARDGNLCGESFENLL